MKYENENKKRPWAHILVRKVIKIGSKLSSPVEGEKVVTSEVLQRGRQVVDVPQRQVCTAQIDRKIPSASNYNKNVIVRFCLFIFTSLINPSFVFLLKKYFHCWKDGCGFQSRESSNKKSL